MTKSSAATQTLQNELVALLRLTRAEAQVARVRQGQRLPSEALADGRVGFVDEARGLVAVAEVQAGRMTLLRVWG